MALIVFTCRETGPFMMFEETVKQIFKTLNRPYKDRGAFAAEDLPALLELLNEAERRDKERIAQMEADREKRFRECSYDEELKLREKEEEEKRQNRERINFYQRLVPLQNMMRRAIEKEEPIMWEPA